MLRNSNIWKEVCFSLHRQYGNPNKRREALVKLYSSRFNPNEESILEFIQRFIKLIRQAQVSSENEDMVDYLLQQLPVNIAIQLESGIQYGRIKRSVIEIEALARTFPGVTSRTKISNNYNTNTNNNIKNNINNSNNNANMKRFVYKHCDIYGKCGHTTDQCYSYKRKNNYINNNNISARYTSNSNNKTSYTVKCYHCNKEGHYANNCPDKEDRTTIRRATLRELNKNLSNNKLNNYEVPIKVNDSLTTALIDTGANISFITQELVNQLQISTKPVQGEIELAIP